MATPPKADLAAKDCHIKVGLFPDLKIQFGTDRDFQTSITIDRHATGLASAIKLRTFSFLMKGKRGDLTVRENFGDGYQVFVRLDRDAFFITQYDNLDKDGNISKTWTIYLTLRPQAEPFKVRYDGTMMKNAIIFFQYLENASVIYKSRNFI